MVKSAASADEELPLRPRAFDQPSRRSKSRDASTASDLGTTALSWFVLFDAVATLLLYAYLATGESGDLQRIRIFTICQGLILGGAFVLALWGVIWLLCMAFVESLFQGVLCLFVPLYSLFFCLSRWDERKGAFGLTMAPFAAILVTLIIGWAAVGTRKVNDGLHGTGQATNETAPADPRNPAPPTNNPQRSNTRSAGGSKAVAPNLRQEYGDRIVAVVVIGMPGHDNPARGATNRDVTTAVSQRLKELAPESVRSQMVYANERLSIVMAPVDDAQGLASRIDFGTVTLNGDRIEVRLDPRYVARVPRLPAESTPEPRTALRRDPVRTPDPEVPVGADSTTRSLIELKSSEVHKKKQAIDRLQRATPDGRVDQVVQAMIPLLDDDDQFLVNDAIKVLAVWRSPEAVPALIGRTRDNRHFVRSEAIKALGKYQDREAAEAVVSVWKEDGFAVEDALKEMGPIAEPAVIPMLRSPDPHLRRKACDVLKIIGGQETLLVMQSLPNDPDFGVRVNAQETWKAIVARVGPPPKPARNTKTGGTRK